MSDEPRLQHMMRQISYRYGYISNPSREPDIYTQTDIELGIKEIEMDDISEEHENENNSYTKFEQHSEIGIYNNDANVDIILPIIRKDFRDLKKWTNIERTTNEYNSAIKISTNQGFTYNPEGSGWWDYHYMIGGFEKISFKIQNIAMDINRDGVVDYRELAESKENRMKTIDHCLSQMLNFSVIGGLAVSVLYSVSLNMITPSDSTKYYLNAKLISVFYYAYYTLLYYSLMQSFMLIYKASRFYLHLSIWMPTLDMKHWYISKISMVPLTYTTNRIIKSVALSIPFGVCVSISPIAGIIALISLMFFYIENIKMTKLDVYIGSKIYDCAKILVQDKNMDSYYDDGHDLEESMYFKNEVVVVKENEKENEQKEKHD